MKKSLFIIIVIFINSTIHAQWQLQPIIDLSYSASLIGAYNNKKAPLYIKSWNGNKPYRTTNVIYQTTTINGGINMTHRNYGLGMMLGYKYSIHNQLRSNFISFSIVNKFRETKIIQPFFSIELATEVNTNYKEGYLDARDLYPIEPTSIKETYPYSPVYNLYRSTPFIGNFLVGCNFKLYQGLSIKASLGYEVRIINVELKNSLPPYTVGKTEITYTLPVNYLTLQLGLSYAFDISKKKTKTEML